MGGKVFGDGDIPKEYVKDIVELTQRALPTGIRAIPDIGSAGYKVASGDMDLFLDAETLMDLFQANDEKAAKSSLANFLQSKGFKTKISGRNVHVEVPYKTDAGQHYAQVDLMVIADAERVAPWHQHGPRGMYDDPQFNASHVYILLNSIAKFMNLKVDAFAGTVMRRDNNEVVADTRKKAAKLLLGSKAKENDLNSVSAIMAALADDPDREGKLAQARQDQAKGLLTLPEDVLPGTGEWIKQVTTEEYNKFDFVKSLKEDITGRTPHPEDSIFNGSLAAADAVKALGSVIANPNNVTIKWDGFPALIFGRTPEGKLAIMDKYMFDKNIMATTTQEWQQYDSTKSSGTMRPDLYAKLDAIWPGLDAVTKGPGFYWGDLLWAGALQPVAGNYAFKPMTVEYHVPVHSQLGTLIGSSTGGIVVHQHFAEFGGEPSTWDGKGLTNIKGGVAIISPSLGTRFTLRDPVQLSRGAAAAVKKYGTAVDSMFANIPKSTKDLIKTYFNKRITAQTNEDLHAWMKNNVSARQYNVLVGDDYSGLMFTKDASGEVTESPGYTGLKAIWNAIYLYKVGLSQQLESQVSGVQQFVNGKPGGEGFVFPTPTGLLKLVNRGQFGVAHFNK